ncbi:hypothetical protein Q9L42_018455 [Methylomarinum sp. Ch1-1]|uniref:Uncharacterized protein n=1 Tax=Methylomarinum roseum TaxID=3067653 RepID=A0AAU7NTL5_9GAMM|nr:hypothetical protein [Methylomarinum sp. Ch1-1]MDP4519640.1 hypothetical protein [Methylomarinum sp. Ch1-1]
MEINHHITTLPPGSQTSNLEPQSLRTDALRDDLDSPGRDSVEFSGTATALAAANENDNNDIATRDQAKQAVQAVRQSATSSPADLAQSQANITSDAVRSLLG